MSASMIRVLYIFVFMSFCVGSRKFSQQDISYYRQKVIDMFHHAYDGYIQYAYPYDELRPLTCDGHDTWGSYSLTLIDALDMLVIMGNNSEFQRVAQLVIDKMNFDNDINVSVFETNIRVVGGLLSAHLMSKRGGMSLEPGWPCSGPLLRMAEDVARRLLPAFDTPTGMPYGTVNLKYGVPVGETTVTCTAGVGTFIVEFGALSKLTGDPIFEKVAMRAMRGLWRARSSINLVGNHIDVATGKWTALDSGVGGGVDSYFEYLVKGSIMLSNTELLDMFYEYLEAAEKYLKRDDWYMWAHMTKGTISLPIFTSLDCYWPGIQAMIGDIDKAMKTIHNFHQVWKQFGFLPEFYNIVKNEAHAGREGYPLRPELIEAAVYLYQATGDSYLLELGVDMLESIEHNTRTHCGYATVKDVTTHTLENRMESFFLAETTKYLYLLFDTDNFIHNSGDHGTVVDTPNGQCVVDTGSYIFNTEAHPIDTAALYCCSAEKTEHDLELQDFHDSLDLLTLFDLHDNIDTVEGVKWSAYKKTNVSKVGNTGNVMVQDIAEKIQKFQINTMGDHQRIMSTKGQKFSVNVKDSTVTKVVTIDGKNIKGFSQNQQHQEQEVKQQAETTKDAITTTQQSCDSDGNCKDLKSDREQETGADDVEDDDLSDAESDTQDPVITTKEEKVFFETENGIVSEDIQTLKDASGNTITIQVDTSKESTVKSDSSSTESLKTSKPIDVTYQTTAATGREKITDVLNLIKSFTEDYLENNGVKSVKTLHEKLKYYSLFHHERPDQLICEAQPFFMRFSLMGEMFMNDFT